MLRVVRSSLPTILLAVAHIGVAPLLLWPGCTEPQTENAARIGALVRAQDFGAMVALLDSEDPDLRCRAARTLSWTTHPSAREAHWRLLDYDRCGFGYRIDAAWRLIETKAEGALARIIPMIADKDERVRWNIAKLIGKKKIQEARAEVRQCRKDPDIFVAAWCGWATCELDGNKNCKTPEMDLTLGLPAP